MFILFLTAFCINFRRSSSISSKNQCSKLLNHLHKIVCLINDHILVKLTKSSLSSLITFVLALYLLKIFEELFQLSHKEEILKFGNVSVSQVKEY